MNSIIGACALLILSQLSEACKPFEMMILQGTVIANGSLETIDRVYGSEHFTRINSTHFNVCVCGVEKCLQKCCPFETAYNGSDCVKHEGPIKLQIYDQHLNKLSSSLNKFRLIFHEETCEDRYNLVANSSAGKEDPDLHYLLTDGRIYLPNSQPSNLTWGSFCVDNFLEGEESTPTVYVCVPDESQQDTFYPYGLIISIPFLIVTLLVYALIPELRKNVSGKNLMSQLSAMIVAYTLLAILQEMSDKDQRATVCLVGTHVVQFSFLATFFWLNVTSYDLWYTFSGPGRLRRGHHQDTVKFRLYSVYAWGSALLITVITVLLDKLPNVSESIIKPNIHKDKCWFTDNSAQLAYFYGPIALILISNIIFFAINAWNLFVFQSEFAKILRTGSSSSAANERKFFLYLKLFFVMGVNWIMEVISAFVTDPNYKYLFVITDICNSLQGVFIFFIFVFKKRTLMLLKEKFGYGKDNERQTGTSMSTSLRNYVTNHDGLALESKSELSRL